MPSLYKVCRICPWAIDKKTCKLFFIVPDLKTSYMYLSRFYLFIYFLQGDYKFSYRVNDTKQDFGHSEHRVGNNTQGRYDVVLPDGRRQIVDYQVLNAAYFADVSYVEETTNRATNLEPASTTSVASLVTNAKIEENMDFPI